MGIKFTNDIEKGRVGEDIVINFLKQNKCFDNIIDVRKDKEYQNMDIDFILKRKDREYKAEVKTDYIAHTTNNICFEIVSNKEYNTDGCILKTKSDILLYYIIEDDKLYIFNTRRLIDSLKELMKSKSHILGIQYRKFGDNAEGFLIPERTLTDVGIRFIRIERISNV